MASYQLIVKLDKKMVGDVNGDKSPRKVVLMKESAGGGANLAWVTFAPFETNTVSWEETYGLYASCSEVCSSAKIEKASYTEACDQQLYSFKNAVFSGPTDDSSIAKNTYKVFNEMKDPDMLTFGLAQDVIANNTTYVGQPINAIQVMANEYVSFTPHEVVQIFMHYNLDDGMVISDTTTPPLRLDFTKKQSITVRYDQETKCFVEE